MSILKVCRLGHPVLRQGTDPVSEEQIRDTLFQKFIDDMVETMREYDGVGLAAPQVHTPLQVAIAEVEDNPRYPEMPPLQLIVMINPRITILSEEVSFGFEGCLSIPDLRGKVPRAKKLKLEALDRQGKAYERTYEGFHARIIQHEYDHLIGRVYLDRMTDMTSLTFLREFNRYWSNAEVEQDIA